MNRRIPRLKRAEQWAQRETIWAVLQPVDLIGLEAFLTRAWLAGWKSSRRGSTGRRNAKPDPRQMDLFTTQVTHSAGDPAPALPIEGWDGVL